MIDTRETVVVSIFQDFGRRLAATLFYASLKRRIVTAIDFTIRSISDMYIQITDSIVSLRRYILLLINHSINADLNPVNRMAHASN